MADYRARMMDAGGGVVVAMSQFHLEGEPPPIPITLNIARKSDG